MVTIKIPCKSYVKKYLIAKYGEKHTISRNTLLGLFTLEYLEKDFKPELGEMQFDDKYVIEIGEYYFKKKGHSISIAKRKMIGMVMERLVREEIFQFVDIQVIDGCDALESIRNYLRFYKISEDELKLDSIYKAYKRHNNFSIRELKAKKSTLKP